MKTENGAKVNLLDQFIEISLKAFKIFITVCYQYPRKVMLSIVFKLNAATADNLWIGCCQHVEITALLRFRHYSVIIKLRAPLIILLRKLQCGTAGGPY